MNPKLLDLRPDRNQLDPNFNGYKLCLNQLSTSEYELPVDLNISLPNKEHYSLLYAKIFGLHNHLIGETINDVDVIYYIDKEFHIVQFLDLEFTNVWDMTLHKERQLGDFNITIKFANNKLAAISDGAGTLFIVETLNRGLEFATWETLFNDEVLGIAKEFIIKDVYLKLNNDNKNELHCLLMSVEQDNDKYIPILHWITLTELETKKWGQTAIRQLKGKGELFYSYFENGAEALYIVSEYSFKYTLDSENPIIDLIETSTDKIYTWAQTNEHIIIKINLLNDEDKSIMVEMKSDEITIKCLDKEIKGKLHQTIDSDLSVWNVENNVLKICLIKSSVGLMWPELITGDNLGDYIVDPSVAQEIHERLGHLCSEIEDESTITPTINSVTMEECDLQDDKTSVFERINLKHEVTHRAHMSTQQILFHVKTNEDNAPALVLRHDVDALLWHPQINSDNKWNLKHDGTLLAFGYIQASKQQKKFCTCSPDLKYSVVCESNRHIFLYHQQRPVTSGELRNRTSGARIQNVAQQQVINLGSDEVLGIFASNTSLFILTETHVYDLKIEPNVYIY